jgi:hypothetical protein
MYSNLPARGPNSSRRWINTGFLVLSVFVNLFYQVFYLGEKNVCTILLWVWTYITVNEAQG